MCGKAQQAQAGFEPQTRSYKACGLTIWPKAQLLGQVARAQDQLEYSGTCVYFSPFYHSGAASIAALSDQRKLRVSHLSAGCAGCWFCARVSLIRGEETDSKNLVKAGQEIQCLKDLKLCGYAGEKLQFAV